jgi:mannose-1-phosphate guanylyltransferase
MKPDSPVTFAVIMAGGSGTRFWPLSRTALPKQLVKVIGDTSMIQATVARLQPLIPAERILVITTVALAEQTRQQLPMLKPEHIIAEPVGRDTAACVCLAALLVERISKGATMILLPADHVIEPADAFQRALKAGIEVAAGGHLVTYGITPRFPATGYGYIKLAARLADVQEVTVNKVLQFVEKPDESTARRYVSEGGYRWNSGIFTWRSDVVLDELETHCQWLHTALTPVAEAFGTPDFERVLQAVYMPLKKISIDYALLEKAENICVITADFTWDDMGSWDTLYEHLPADERGVISSGEVLGIDCRDCLLMTKTQQLIVGVGLQNLTVVVTKDAILIIPKGRSQQVKQAVDALRAQGRAELL